MVRFRCRERRGPDALPRGLLTQALAVTVLFLGSRRASLAGARRSGRPALVTIPVLGLGAAALSIGVFPATARLRGAQHF